MSKVFFCGDLHLGHKNITYFRKDADGGVIDKEHHDQMIVDTIIDSVGRNDKLFILGDVCFTEHAFDKYFTQIVNHVQNITICLGNHDINKNVPYSKYLDLGVNLASSVYYKKFILSHIPVHPREFKRFVGNIHGHLHTDKLTNPRYYCVSMEADLCNYKPVSYDSIMAELRRRVSVTIE